MSFTPEIAGSSSFFTGSICSTLHKSKSCGRTLAIVAAALSLLTAGISAIAIGTAATLPVGWVVLGAAGLIVPGVALYILFKKKGNEAPVAKSLYLRCLMTIILDMRNSWKSIVVMIRGPKMKGINHL